MAGQTTKVVLTALAGLLLIIAGIRDLVAPGFLAISRHTSSRLEIGIMLALGLVFLVLSGRVARRRRAAPHAQS